MFLSPFNCFWYLSSVQVALCPLQIQQIYLPDCYYPAHWQMGPALWELDVLFWVEIKLFIRTLRFICFTGSEFFLCGPQKFLWRKECSISLLCFKSGTKSFAHLTGTRRRSSELTYPYICLKINLNQKHISQMRISPLEDL